MNLPKILRNAELTAIVVFVLAIKTSIFDGELIPTIFLIDNFITVLIIFSILDLYGCVKERYKERYSNN
ncbi:hypothetical protein [Mammaliicoccus sp. JADD-157]|uniref:hypothetical protein n=1 Tax=Mammaliicoccus sp. JADD-157 TaxID=3404818 RepID=UPI003BB491A5